MFVDAKKMFRAIVTKQNFTAPRIFLLGTIFFFLRKGKISCRKKKGNSCGKETKNVLL